MCGKKSFWIFPDSRDKTFVLASKPFLLIKKQDPFLIFLSNPTLVSESSEAQPVRFVFLLSFDALRADHLGTYGYQRPTSPNIDAFARDSVLFENASTAATWTLPSFGSVFTSLYPSFHDAKDYTKPLSRSLRTLPELIDNKGYSTAAFVHNPLLHPIYGFAKGFDSYNYHISKNVKGTSPDFAGLAGVFQSSERNFCSYI